MALIETTEQFALRRVQWAADQFISQHLKPNRWELMRVSGIGPSTRNISSVERAITEAMTHLHGAHIRNSNAPVNAANSELHVPSSEATTTSL